MKFIIGIIMLIVLTKRNQTPQSNITTPVINALQPTPSNVVNPAATVTNPVVTAPVEPEYAPAVVDPDYLATEKVVLQNAIEKEIIANGRNPGEVTTKGMLRRKTINALLFAVITFICVSLFFFHFPTWTYLTELIVIYVFVKSNAKYSTKDYLVKEAKARPDEKISNIVASILAEDIKDTFVTKSIRIALIIAPFIVALLVYSEPHFLYEKAEDGYHVRFYTTTLFGEEEITVPDEYNGEPITGIRGNVFANLKRVEKITLPDTINTIRGKAFKNDKNLFEINLPADLTYLGGSAFYNCESLEEITIPEGVTEIQGGTFNNCYNLRVVNLHDNIEYIHGESFINCKALETIELPSKITEIRGNTFQGCSSLDNIVIPEGVTRIGGHAFEDCSSLSNITFPRSLREIGSSAFRRCYSLDEVTIPYGTMREPNSFKESNTTINYFPESSPSGTEYKNYKEISVYMNSPSHVFTDVGPIYGFELVGMKKLYDSSYSSEYEYSIEVTTDNFEKEITISSVEKSKKINNDIEVEYDPEANTYGGSWVGLKVYYN